MPVTFKDYCVTLGVPRDASADDIKKAFRKLVRIGMLFVVEVVKIPNQKNGHDRDEFWITGFGLFECLNATSGVTPHFHRTTMLL
jgi:hypothetical protein